MKKIIALLLVIALSLFYLTGTLFTSSSLDIHSSMMMDGPEDVPAQVLPL